MRTWTTNWRTCSSTKRSTAGRQGSWGRNRPCIEWCQVSAIAEQDGVAVVCRERCLGCGLCVTACPTGAGTLQPIPAADALPPPADFAAWERERLRNRGIPD
ncbi:MAG: hypothetical protein COZ06_23740 [Armatimonadetes bacterium CG_4_10_14_3_um_filter_66_18]|nr:hypothetical protein [Armatimonadota bacterium]PIU93657.1 MAG: hypothetical protein COS65_11640 [Armatimonadetes bacterium CG06_land_8_20_14_3_00_66_21]PIX41505.1 MAG: hypothetical protein COZ57_23255 [Armatimonadetes bacterium CG_4_8_14_3_um_filter_66_20]PIY43028.1 MAG: hypothetical protein COZ06_23740 [Armatimonadetes bacterium CG_4_10_14_3_um_filter_66_18]